MPKAEGFAQQAHSTSTQPEILAHIAMESVAEQNYIHPNISNLRIKDLTDSQKSDILKV